MLASDAPLVSVGAQLPPYNDAAGSLVATAVLIRSPDNPDAFPSLVYRPSRVDVLMATMSPQTSRRGLSDFYVTLHSDDGSEQHNPAAQVRASCGLKPCARWMLVRLCFLQLAPPLLMASLTNPLTTTRGSWYQQDVTGAGWPILNASTYYWVAVTPSVPLTMTTQGGGVYNGARWVGLNDATNPVPAVAATDPHIFKGRQIVSQRFRGDSAFAATSSAAAVWIASQPSWQTLGTRFTDWDLGNTSVRYGVQLLGWQIWPTPSVTRSGTQLRPRDWLPVCV